MCSCFARRVGLHINNGGEERRGKESGKKRKEKREEIMRAICSPIYPTCSASEKATKARCMQVVG